MRKRLKIQLRRRNLSELNVKIKKDMLSLFANYYRLVIAELMFYNSVIAPIFDRRTANESYHLRPSRDWCTLVIHRGQSSY